MLRGCVCALMRDQHCFAAGRTHVRARGRCWAGAARCRWRLLPFKAQLVELRACGAGGERPRQLVWRGRESKSRFNDLQAQNQCQPPDGPTQPLPMGPLLGRNGRRAGHTVPHLLLLLLAAALQACSADEKTHKVGPRGWAACWQCCGAGPAAWGGCAGRTCRAPPPARPPPVRAVRGRGEGDPMGEQGRPVQQPAGAVPWCRRGAHVLVRPPARARLHQRSDASGATLHCALGVLGAACVLWIAPCRWPAAPQGEHHAGPDASGHLLHCCAGDVQLLQPALLQGALQQEAGARARLTGRGAAGQPAHQQPVHHVLQA